MVGAFGAADRVGCVTGLVLPLRLETPAQMWFEEYRGFAKGLERRVFDLRAHRPVDQPLFPYSAGVLGAGSSMAFDREVLVRLGGYDPGLGNGTPALGGVDIEAFFRVLRDGHALVYEPAAIALHVHRREFEELRRQVHDFGAGLTAFLTKSLVQNPRLIPDVLRRVPRAIAFAASLASQTHSRRASSYPVGLRRAELHGMVIGPLAWVRSRRRLGKHHTAPLRADDAAPRNSR